MTLLQKVSEFDINFINRPPFGEGPQHCGHPEAALRAADVNKPHSQTAYTHSVANTFTDNRGAGLSNHPKSFLLPHWVPQHLGARY